MRTCGRLSVCVRVCVCTRVREEKEGEKELRRKQRFLRVLGVCACILVGMCVCVHVRKYENLYGCACMYVDMSACMYVYM